MLTALVRTVILYILIILALRLMGKRQIAELEPSELVLALLISDLAAVPMQDFDIPISYGILPILTLTILSMLISFGNLKSIRFRNFTCGTPNMLICNGHLDQQELRKTRYTVDELLEDLRLKGVTELSTVQYAILETSGQLSVLLYPKYQPLTQETLHRSAVSSGGVPVLLISDGRLLEKNLKSSGLTLSWLERQLTKYGFQTIGEVFLMTVDHNRKITILKKE